MIGRGKYDDLCTQVREQTKADAVILIIRNGEHGDGFSMQATLPVLLTLPDMLEFLAKEIRADMERGKL